MTVSLLIDGFGSEHTPASFFDSLAYWIVSVVDYTVTRRINFRTGGTTIG